MKSSTLSFDSPMDGAKIHVYCWMPDDEHPDAVIQIAHGMAEHAGRYARLAQALTDAGWAVYANDHRGHGQSMLDGLPGYFADNDGWDAVVADMHALNTLIHEQHSGVPIGLIGHSMGSFLSQSYLIRHSDSVDAAVLSATSGAIGPMRLIGLNICRAERLRVGARGTSPVIDFMGFGAFNRAFTPTRTDYDWLSRDEMEVDQYVADALCGFSCTTQMWIDLLTGLGENEKPSNIANIRSDLPVYLLTGMADPSNHGIVGPAKLADKWYAAGVAEIEIKAWPGGRHEMFNEINRDAVTDEMIRWIARQFA